MNNIDNELRNSINVLKKTLNPIIKKEIDLNYIIKKEIHLCINSDDIVNQFKYNDLFKCIRDKKTLHISVTSKFLEKEENKKIILKEIDFCKKDPDRPIDNDYLFQYLIIDYYIKIDLLFLDELDHNYIEFKESFTFQEINIPIFNTILNKKIKNICKKIVEETIQKIFDKFGLEKNDESYEIIKNYFYLKHLNF